MSWSTWTIVILAGVAALGIIGVLVWGKVRGYYVTWQMDKTMDKRVMVGFYRLLDCLPAPQDWLRLKIDCLDPGRLQVDMVNSVTNRSVEVDFALNEDRLSASVGLFIGKVRHDLRWIKSPKTEDYLWIMDQMHDAWLLKEDADVG